MQRILSALILLSCNFLNLPWQNSVGFIIGIRRPGRGERNDAVETDLAGLLEDVEGGGDEVDVVVIGGDE